VLGLAMHCIGHQAQRSLVQSGMQSGEMVSGITASEGRSWGPPIANPRSIVPVCTPAARGLIGRKLFPACGRPTSPSKSLHIDK